MSILKKAKRILNARINAILDRAADPVEMAEQLLIERHSDLAQLKAEAAIVIAEEKRNYQLLKENEKQIEEYAALAEQAVIMQNEGDAGIFLSKKGSLIANGKVLQEAYNEAKRNGDVMRRLFDQIVEDINLCKSRLPQIEAMDAVAKARERVAKVGDSFKKGGDAASEFTRLEGRIKNRLQRATEASELDERARTSDLAVVKRDWYKEHTVSADVQKEILEIKERLKNKVS